MTKTKRKESPSLSLYVLSFLGELMNKVGIIGFLVIVGVIFIWKFASEEQKKGIIDTWLLFKNPNAGINASIFLNFVLFALFIFHNFHYKSKIKSLKQNIEFYKNKPIV